ncbi:MAG: PaaI family thioesterase [Actinomycetaceae bacterium]|nr:PaaI family thioesterase [Actinomycetaceae bacterium]MDU0969546.1 PaaI family thioesterase [Actinomycetaceae bacterium]
MSDLTEVERMLSLETTPAQRAAWLAALPDVTDRSEMAQGNAVRALGLKVHIIGSDVMVCSLPVDGNEQHMGILHGGMHAVLGETTGSFAACHGCEPGWTALGLDISMHHHRGVAEGRVWCLARCVSRTRSFASYQLAVYRDDGKVASTGYHTCALRPVSETAEARMPR